MNRRILYIAIILFSSPFLYAQQVKDSFKITDTRMMDTYKSMGYVYHQLVKYYPEGDEASAASYWEPREIVDTVRIMGSFEFKKHTYTVTSIRKLGFENVLRIKNIVLPESIKEIGAGAFDGCSYLQSINIPSQCEVLRGSALARTEIRSLILPEGVKSLGGMLCYQCRYLKYVELPSTLERIGEEAFYYCEGLKTVRVHFKEPLPIERKHFFYTTPTKDIKLIVPKGSIDAFKKAEGWKLFYPIVEEDDE